MPTYRIKGPDGKTYQVEAPEGATQEEVLARVKSQTKPQDPWYEDLGEGYMASMMDLGLGLKDLMAKSPISPSLSPRIPTPEQGVTDWDRSRLKEWKEDASESGWGTAGRIGGELHQLAIPGGAGYRLYRTLQATGKQLPKLAKHIPFAADLVGSAATGAARLPEEGETRGGEALRESVGALAGKGVEEVGRVALAGARGTPEAARLRDQGVKLTAGQTLGGRARETENLLRIVPFFARPIKKGREAAEESLRRTAIREAAPPTPESLLTDTPVPIKLSKNTREARQQLQDAYDAGYEKAFTPIKDMPPETVQQLGVLVNSSKPRLTKSERAILQRTVEDINNVATNDPAASLARVDKIIRDNLQGTPKRKEIDRVLHEMRDTIRSSQPPEYQRALQLLDEKYPNFIAIRNAIGSSGASKKVGEFSLDELNQGARAAANKYTRGTARQPYMQYLDDAYTAHGQVPGVLPSAALRVIQSPVFFDPAGLVGFTSRRLAGTGLGQKEARRVLESELAKQLRYGVSGARAGAAIVDEDED